MKKSAKLLFYTFLIVSIGSFQYVHKVYGEEINAESPEAAIERIYDERCKAFITGDSLTLKNFYDTSQKQGVWAFEHEVKRIKYLREWAKERGIQFTDVESSIRIKKMSPKGEKRSLSLEETYKFEYIYPKDANDVMNTFGVGIRHGLNLIKKNEIWVIYNDWYTDCFEDALSGYSAEIQSNEGHRADFDAFNKEEKGSSSIFNRYFAPRYNREKAVQYADKYCGGAWGSTNNYKYNPKYSDYTGIGGDCTNFVSQALGDKAEGGGMVFGNGWHCAYKKYGRAEGSRAFVNADGFKGFLLYSGRGHVIRRGSFKEITTSTDGSLQKLQIGDVVGYEKKGDMDHFAIVTGKDSQGYPLVNSHTTDRYHVPWDLGWGDKGIRFYLIHIN